MFFRKFYSYFNFCARERNLGSFFLANGMRAQDFFKKTYADNISCVTYEHPPNLKRPAYPFCPFKTNPPTKEEISVSLKDERNGSAPGLNGIPYLVYKKVPFLLCHLSLILQEMWPSFDLPQSRFGATGFIHKNGSDEEVSNYCPVTVNKHRWKDPSVNFSFKISLIYEIQRLLRSWYSKGVH